jgi:hypothetical protein
VPEVRIRLPERDPLLFALIYLPDLLKVEGEIRVTDDDRHAAADALQLVGYLDHPEAHLMLEVHPRWWSIIPLWAGAHGHVGATYMTGVNPRTVMDLALNNALIRTDFPACGRTRRWLRA